MTDPLAKLMAELLLEIKKLNANLQHQPSVPDEWQPVAIAAVKLHRSTSRLKQLRKDGILTEAGGQIRNVSHGDRPTWEYNIFKCQQAIAAYFEQKQRSA
jgi:hypothetical protein